jgi:hypothetical protein
MEDFSVGVSEPRLPQVPGKYSNPHCKEISIYVFPEKEQRGLGPFFTFMFLFLAIGPPIFLQQNGQTNRENI